MKKVLILAYDFPPYVSVGGLRPYSWFKYMTEFGVYPIVITRQWGNKFGNHLDYIAPGDSNETIVEESESGMILRTPYVPNFSNKLLLKYGDAKFKFVRKGISAFYEFGQYIFPIGPKSNLYFEADKYLRKNKVDAIIATGDPFILFKYASVLSKKYNVPWIADYRDPWSQDKNWQKAGIPKIWDAIFEKKYSSNAIVITTVADFFQKQISTLLPDKTFYIISNGYDSDAVEKVKKVEQSKEKLKIAIVGTIYEYHPLESILRVVDNFVKGFLQTPKFEIVFYGTNIEDKIRQLITDKYNALESVIRIVPKIPNEKFLMELATNNAFLLFNYYSIIGTKIFDYIALKRRIIFCYENDEEAEKLKNEFYGLEEEDLADERPQIELLTKTNSGIIVKDSAHLKEVLRSLYEEFLINGCISCESADVEQFSRKVQAGKMVEVINRVT